MTETDVDGQLVLQNKAGNSKNPYVRRHGEHPVAWQTWGEEALALAKQHNRPIFLSIGYAACHWCHVMERESFQSEEVAELVNQTFIPIILDREERPDIDTLYMNYVEATTGTGGWPLNMFLTPELDPVHGLTFCSNSDDAVPHSDDEDVLPQPDASERRLLFLTILRKMGDAWATKEQLCRDAARESTQQLRGRAEEGVHGEGHENPKKLPDLHLFDDAVAAIRYAYDDMFGGFHYAPKFLVPFKVQFLLNLGQWPAPLKHLVGGQLTVKCASMAIETMRSIARGGVRDHLGGGIFRYSKTLEWGVPCFEKLLLDQALLLDTYLDTFLLTHDAEMLGVVYGLADFITSRPMAQEGGGYYSSEDSDSAPSFNDTELREGAFHVWTERTLKEVLGAEDAEIVACYYGVKSDGNVPIVLDPHDDFTNQNTLAIVTTPEIISKENGIAEDHVVAVIKAAKVALREHRKSTRPPPKVDEKVVTAFNGAAIAAVARTAAALASVEPQAAEGWLNSALSTARFVLDKLYTPGPKPGDGTLWRVWHDGERGDTEGLAEDYAAMVKACIELYTATFDVVWLQWADDLQAAQINKFWAETGGFYTTGDKSDVLIRLKAGMDNVGPSVNSLSALNLCRLATALEDSRYEQLARRTVAAHEPEIEQFPSSFLGLLQATAWLEGGRRQIILEGPEAFSAMHIDLGEAIRKLRTQTGVGRMLIRFPDPGDEGEQWLRRRRTSELRMLAYDGKRYRELHDLRSLF